MRVLMIGWFADKRNSGGMEVHIREVCRNLSSEGHSVELVMPGAAQKPMDETGAKMHYVSCKIACNSLGGVIKSVRNFNKKIIAEFKKSKASFDVIHSHDWLGVEAAGILAKKSGKPWIHTVHSLEHIRATEDTKSEISKIEKQGMLGCDKLITVSNLMKKEIIKKYKIPPEKISVIHNYAGVSGIRLHREPGTSRTILYIGRLAFQKGIEHLVLAHEKVLKEIPSAKLVIAGGGNLKEGLKSLAASYGIGKSILFKGFVRENELIGLYRSATLFVSPSVFEPFGITVLDAVKFGVPVIATKNTGCLELFSDGNIAVAESENSGDIAEKIIRLLEDKAERLKMAESAKKDLEKADDWRMIAEKTAEVYGAQL